MKLVVIASVLSLLPSVALNESHDVVPGHVMIARATKNALVLFDASPLIAKIVATRMSDRDANDRLERYALAVLAQSLPKLDESTISVTVRIIYTKDNTVSPAYGTPTFAGVERYALLEAPYKKASADRGKWHALDSTAAFPPWSSFRVIGRLPPR